MQCCSAFTGQLGESQGKGLDKPDVDRIENLPPAFAVGHRFIARNSRATVGTLTEIADNLQLLLAIVGTVHCPQCGQSLHAATTSDVVRAVEALPAGTRFSIAFPSHPSGDIAAWIAALREQGFVRAQIAGKVVRFDDTSQPQVQASGRCFILIDRLETGRFTPDRLFDALESAFVRGDGQLALLTGDRETLFNRRLICSKCPGNSPDDQCGNSRLAGRGFGELCFLSVSDLAALIQSLDLTSAQRESSQLLLEQIHTRLDNLLALELGYLSLDRPVRTLSTGECQRVWLTNVLASKIVHGLYVLEEPTAGLHPRDTEKLLVALRRLRDVGNTVVLVEHDAEVIRAADFVADLGPGSGEEGGTLVYHGPPADLARCEASLTGAYLSGRKAVALPLRRRPLEHGCLRLVGARTHHLKDLTVEFPLGVFCVITGISGAGKSSLVEHTLYPALRRCPNLEGSTVDLPAETEVAGAEKLSDVLWMDHTPLSRPARTNAATYVKVFDAIRQHFADQDDNIRNLSMAQALGLTVREAFRFFRANSGIQRRLKMLLDVGLEYLRLGQTADTLSGGESLRLKLAGYLALNRKPRCLFLLDEPSAGLHPADLPRLLECFDNLLQTGHSLIVIEHNLDMIKCADHVIDLGPGAGADGGRVVAQGTPEEVAGLEDSHTGLWLRRLFHT